MADHEVGDHIETVIEPEDPHVKKAYFLGDVPSQLSVFLNHSKPIAIVAALVTIGYFLLKTRGNR